METGEIEDVSRDTATFESAAKPTDRSQMPLPIVTGGFGLLFAFVLPGGLTGGEGFVVGLLIGCALLWIASIEERLAARDDRRLDEWLKSASAGPVTVKPAKTKGLEIHLKDVVCPSCGSAIHVVSEPEVHIG